MDWKKLLSRLTVGRLRKLAHNAGLSRRRRRKAELIAALASCFDHALKQETLALLSTEELVALAKKREDYDPAANKAQLIASLLDDEMPGSYAHTPDRESLPDQGRNDIPSFLGPLAPTSLVPSYPSADASRLIHEIQHLLRDPNLASATLAQGCCNTGLLPQLLVEHLDDFVENLVRRRRFVDPSRPLLTVVLDAENHGLDQGPVGPVLVALAEALPSRLELRLARADRRLDTSLFCFETTHHEDPRIVCFSSSSETPLQTPAPHQLPLLAAIKVASSLDDCQTAASLFRNWTRALLCASEPLDVRPRPELERAQSVTSNVAYKRDFDTAHELALKHLAEQLARRGRHAHALYDPHRVTRGYPQQDLAVATAATPWLEGLLLLDESGLGKTVAIGQILSRELRRARQFGAARLAPQRLALVVCTRSQMDHWCSELHVKFGLRCQASEATDSGAHIAGRLHNVQVVVCPPDVIAAHWEDVQDISVLILDEPQLFDEKATAALHALRKNAELCLVASGQPLQSELYDLIPLAALAAPNMHWEQWLDLPFEEELFGEELRSIALRALREPLLASGEIVVRDVIDRPYALDPNEAAAYREIRQMRTDYLERAEVPTGWLFAALERCFLSSSQAFAAIANRLLQGETNTYHEDLFGRRRDASFEFLEESSYFRRRIRNVLDQLGLRGRGDSATSPKEFALSDLLDETSDQDVVVFCAYQTTAIRLARFFADVFADRTLLYLDHKAPLVDREQMLQDAYSQQADTRSQPLGRIILCPDQAAQGLNLQRFAAMVINYDIPWSPQRLDQRVKAVHRLGQQSDVRVFNMLACDADHSGWTMDHRIINTCRKLFGLAEPSGKTNASLRELDPNQLESELADSDAVRLSLLEAPSPQAAAALSNLLAGGETAWRSQYIKEHLERDNAFRTRLQHFSQFLGAPSNPMAPTEPYLYGRIQQALLQGAVGILCAPDRQPETCTKYHLATGLRIVYEVDSAVSKTREHDQWRIEDEEVYLWAVSPNAKLIDWSTFLTESTLQHLQPEQARSLLGQQTLDYLIDCKGRLERHDLDALPADLVLESAPGAVATRLFVATERANTLAKARLQQLSSEWLQHQTKQVKRLERRLLHATASAASSTTIQALTKSVDRLRARRVRFRHQLLVTQLFIIAH